LREEIIERQGIPSKAKVGQLKNQLLKVSPRNGGMMLSKTESLLK
jgi:hypothetical protein